MNDFGIDGLNWWANTAQGTGFVRFRNGTSNAIIKTFNADFGSFIEYNFTTNYALNVSHLEFGNSINLYPNPATNKFSLQGVNLENSQVEVFDVLGHKIDSKAIAFEHSVDFITENWKSGLYMVVVTKGNLRTTKKLLVY